MSINNLNKQENIINKIKIVRSNLQKNYFEIFNLLSQKKINANGDKDKLSKIDLFQKKIDDAMNYTIPKLDFLLQENNISLLQSGKIRDKDFDNLFGDNFLQDDSNIYNLSKKEIDLISSDELDTIDSNLNQFLYSDNYDAKYIDEVEQILNDQKNLNKPNEENLINSKVLFFDEKIKDVEEKFNDKYKSIENKEKIYNKINDDLFLELTKLDDKFLNFKKNFFNSDFFLDINNSINVISNKISFIESQLPNIDNITNAIEKINSIESNFSLDNLGMLEEKFNRLIQKNYFKIEEFLKNLLNENYNFQKNYFDSSEKTALLMKALLNWIKNFKIEEKDFLLNKNKINNLESILFQQIEELNKVNDQKNELIFSLENKINSIKEEQEINDEKNLSKNFLDKKIDNNIELNLINQKNNLLNKNEFKKEINNDNSNELIISSNNKINSTKEEQETNDEKNLSKIYLDKKIDNNIELDLINQKNNLLNKNEFKKEINNDNSNELIISSNNKINSTKEEQETNDEKNFSKIYLDKKIDNNIELDLINQKNNLLNKNEFKNNLRSNYSNELGNTNETKSTNSNDFDNLLNYENNNLIEKTNKNIFNNDEKIEKNLYKNNINNNDFNTFRNETNNVFFNNPKILEDQKNVLNKINDSIFSSVKKNDKGIFNSDLYKNEVTNIDNINLNNNSNYEKDIYNLNNSNLNYYKKNLNDKVLKLDSLYDELKFIDLNFSLDSFNGSKNEK